MNLCKTNLLPTSSSKNKNGHYIPLYQNNLYECRSLLWPIPPLAPLTSTLFPRFRDAFLINAKAVQPDTDKPAACAELMLSGFLTILPGSVTRYSTSAPDPRMLHTD